MGIEEAQIAQAHHSRYVGTVDQDRSQLPVEGMMRLITVLNRCTTFKRFVFEGSHFGATVKCCGCESAMHHVTGVAEESASGCPWGVRRPL